MHQGRSRPEGKRSQRPELFLGHQHQQLRQQRSMHDQAVIGVCVLAQLDAANELARVRLVLEQKAAAARLRHGGV